METTTPHGTSGRPDMPHENEMNWGVSKFLLQAGFTLTELMIGIAIVGILATIAVPNILGEMPKFRLNGAARQVLGDLMAARMRSVSHNTKVKMFFVDTNQYKICDVVNNDSTLTDCGIDAKVVNIQDNYKGVTLSSGEINPVFQPRGTISPMTIDVMNSYGTKKIKIAITGRIKITS